MTSELLANTNIADEARAVATLVVAFVNDPAVRWIYPSAQQYHDHFPDFVRAFGGEAFKCGTADCTDDHDGVALWLPPGVQPDDDALAGMLQRSVRAERLTEMFSLFGQMGEQHPAEPHWYLPLIGVHPGAQQRGVGSRLLRRALERCDREQLPAYLESTTPRNLPLYERFGFKATGWIQTPTSPPIIPMLRRPR